MEQVPALIADAPEILRLLQLGNSWRFALKRLTPADLQQGMVEKVLQAAGIHISLSEMELLTKDLQEGKFPGKNMADIVGSEEFQTRVQSVIKQQPVPALGHVSTPDEVEETEHLIVCKHCKQIATYTLS
jgi:hypothetical protein